MEDFGAIKKQISACKLCEEGGLIPEANPIIQVSDTARVGVFGQAPGNLAHQSGKPFFDPSGRRLRAWMGVTDAEFYDAAKLAIIPMAFCFPGYDGKGKTGKGGDLPPPGLCAETWRDRLMHCLRSQLKLVLLVGNYAQRWHLGNRMERTLTDTVKKWSSLAEEFSNGNGPVYIPLPHPSWRNNGWLRKNPWFERDLLPFMQAEIRRQIEACE